MTLQAHYEDDAGREREESHGFPSRAAAAIVMLTALTFVDAAPGVADEPSAIERRHEQSAPSACGAEAVARAQREVGKSQRSIDTALS